MKGTRRDGARTEFFVAAGAGPADSKGPIQVVPDPGVLIVYEAATGKVVRRFDHPARCSCVAFSPDGALLAVGDVGGAVVLRDAATWEVKHTLQAGATPLVRLAFAPKGRWLATASEDAVRLWELGSCDLVASASEDAVAAIAFDATGDRLFTASGRVVRVRDVPKLRHLLALPANDPVPSKFLAVAYDAKAGVLAGLETTGRLQLWGGHLAGVGKVEVGRTSPGQAVKGRPEGAPAPPNPPVRQKGEPKDTQR
jgi:WD40 repeat protein